MTAVPAPPEAPGALPSAARRERPLLEVNSLSRDYASRSGTVHAVRDVNLEVHRGQTLALVGESGCGKSTTARMILGLLSPTSGSITFDGTTLPPRLGGRRDRSRSQMHAVFQDSFSSLDPRMTIAASIAEPLGGRPRAEVAARVQELLDVVGLGTGFAQRYPHQMSGGQRQRVGIARALARRPSLVVMDEPVSALDLSVQAQILVLLQDLKRELGVATVFISHDLGVVRHISDTVAIMYRGRVVEYGPTAEVFAAPAHRYTRVLLGAVLPADPVVARTRRPVQETLTEADLGPLTVHAPGWLVSGPSGTAPAGPARGAGGDDAR